MGQTVFSHEYIEINTIIYFSICFIKYLKYENHSVLEQQSGSSNIIKYMIVRGQAIIVQPSTSLKEKVDRKKNIRCVVANNDKNNSNIMLCTNRNHNF